MSLKRSSHICSIHGNEEVVRNLLKPSRSNSSEQKERQRTLDKLRNEGDFLHNIEVLKRLKGVLVVGRPVTSA